MDLRFSNWSSPLDLRWTGGHDLEQTTRASSPPEDCKFYRKKKANRPKMQTFGVTNEWQDDILMMMLSISRYGHKSHCGRPQRTDHTPRFGLFLHKRRRANAANLAPDYKSWPTAKKNDFIMSIADAESVTSVVFEWRNCSFDTPIRTTTISLGYWCTIHPKKTLSKFKQVKKMFEAMQQI